MSLMKPFVLASAFVAISGLLLGCVIGAADSRHDRDDGRSSPRRPSGSGEVGGLGDAPSEPSALTSPMLVEVDTDEVMTADPGQGVGVFTEYKKGGLWRIWWTCDTAPTQQTCDFAVIATAASGNIANVDAGELQGGFVATPTASRVEAKVTTSTEVHGITFTTTPGAVITLEASVGGIKDGAFLFFVQNKKVNGGFQGKLTNPLQLQGKSP